MGWSVSPNFPVTLLTNGNYVVKSRFWSVGSVFSVGAVTWGSGTAGVKGTVSSANSLVGSKAYDGSCAVTPLKNGNYVVQNPVWDNGSIVDAGAVTWCNGSTGTSGIISSTNSLVGTKSNDQVGNSLTALTNGNYVVISSLWSNGSTMYTGAVTWGNGASGIKGAVTATNSLIGKASDFVGDRGVAALTNGNYVVLSSSWTIAGSYSLGAITLGNGSAGTTGLVSAENSLTGSTSADNIGNEGIFPLPNGNFVISSSSYSDGTYKGAVTWASGTAGVTGSISTANSLVGKPGDQVGGFRSITVLPNSNYLVRTPSWSNESIQYVGAVTFGNGISGVKGEISQENSLIGSLAYDRVGSEDQIEILANGAYLIDSKNWNNGDETQKGAITYGKADVGAKGMISSCNSVTGTYSFETTKRFTYNPQYQYTVIGSPLRNSVTLYNPSGISPLLAESEDATSVSIVTGKSTEIIAKEGCRVLASLESTGSSPVQGAVAVKIWVESDVPTYGGTPLVSRHYQLTPDQNASTATARIKLYFSQAEFNAFNAHQGSLLNLPTGPDDTEGKSNLKIAKFSGVSSTGTGTGTGMPASYSGNSVNIDPSDQDIIWNAALSRWEVAFNVQGFSGFFVHTNATPLPVKLISFSGKRQENSVSLQWKITDAENFSHFQVQRSPDAKNFQTFETVDFLNTKQQYELTDQDASGYVNNNNKVFYRLKMVDLDGSSALSRIIEIEIPGASKNLNYVYPNPFQKDIAISLVNHNGQTATVSLVNANGEILTTKKVIVSNDKLLLHFDKEGISVGQYTLSIWVEGEKVGVRVLKGE